MVRRFIIILVFIILCYEEGCAQMGDFSIGFGFSKLIGDEEKFYNLGGTIHGKLFQYITHYISIGMHVAYNEYTLNMKKISEFSEELEKILNKIKIKTIEIIPTFRLITGGQNVNFIGQIGMGYFNVNNIGGTTILSMGGC